MKNYQNEINDIVCEIALNNRVGMIKCIKRNAEEEYENLKSLWELAEKTKKELRQILKSIYNYYSNEK